jgi:hypothetical protein
MRTCLLRFSATVVAFVLITCLPIVGAGQTLIDSYTDGDFTASPVWGGSTSAWTIVANSDAAAGATGSNTVRLASTGSATVYLSTQIATWADSQEWGFFVGRRAQAYTAANQAYLWLYANEANLTSATVDGYRIAIGDDSGDDNIRLEYIVNGAVSSTVITSSGAITNGLTDIGFLLRVTRSSSGGWVIFTSTLPTSGGNGAIATSIPNSTNATVNQGSATHNTLVPTTNGYLGFGALHSSGGNAIIGVEIDQVYFTATATTSSSSNIIATSGFTYPTNVDYASYQTASGLTTSNSLEVAQFDIQDGGGSADADALATTLTAISFNVANHANLRRIALFDGSTNVGEVAAGSTASFSSLTLAAADGTTPKTFSIRVTYASSVTDNQQYSFTVSSATASGAGSGFAAANAGGAASSTTGDINKIEVATTAIIFDQDVSNVPQGGTMSPSPTVRAIDGNLNYDVDNTSNVVLTITAGTTTFDPGATATVAMVAGVATFDDLVFNTSASGNQLTATQGAFTDVSASFDVTASAPEINVKQNLTSLANGVGSHAAGNQVSGTSGSAITFTIENLGSADLTYSSIISSNTTDFTLDISGASSPIVAAGNTTFTVTFNPQTTGGKSTTITITNNDGDEGSYTFTVTGTGTASAVSDITTTGGFSYVDNVAYASFQTAGNAGTPALTDVNSVAVAGVTIRDGGASTDADNLGTTLTALSFTTGGSTAIRGAALFDGSTNLKEVEVNGATTIAFTGLSVLANDGGTKNLVLRVTYQSTVTDNQQIVFTVSSATAASTGSGFAAADAGAAASSSTGDNNKIEVTATALAFVQQPTSTGIGTNMTPAVTVRANDANGNLDLDYATNVNITSDGTLSSSPQTATPASGIASFSTINHTAPASGRKLTAASGALSTVESNTFNITVQEAGTLLLEDNFNHSGILTSNGYTASSGTGTNNLTAGATGLTYSNFGSSGVGNALAVANTGQDVWEAFSKQSSPTTVYAAFLVNVSAAQTAGDYFFAFAPEGAPTTYRARTFIKSSSNSGFINFGISNAGTATYGTTDFAVNTTHLVVVKYTFTSATSATATVYINPSTSAEPGTSEVSVNDVVGANAPADITSFSIRQGTAANAPTLVMDGIRIATNWGSAIGNVQYNGNATLAAGTYSSISVSSGTVTQTGTVTVTGNIINNGILAINPSDTLIVNGSVSGSGTISGSSTSNLTIGGAAGTLSFTSGARTLQNLVIGTGSNASMSLGSALDIAPNGSITFNASGTKTLTTTGQTLTLKSTSAGTALIGNTNGATITGNVTVERFISAATNTNRAYRLLTPGVTTSTTIKANWQEGVNNTAQDFGSNINPNSGFGTHITGSTNGSNGFDATLNASPSMFTYTPGNPGSWTAISNTDVNTLDAKTGYLLFIRGDRGINLSQTVAAQGSSNTVLRATGTVLTGNQTFTVSGTNNNFSLITNPYPSPISWTSVINDADNTGKFAIQYTLWDPNISTRGGYVTVTNGGLNTGGGNATVNIQSGQAFFVRNTDGLTTSFSIKESHKSTTNNIDVFRIGAQQEMLRAGLFFTHTDNTRRQADGVVTVYDNNYSAAFDGNDAMQIANWDEDIAIISNSKELSIESRPLADNGDTIFFNMARLREINYEWEFTAENFNAPGLTAYVQDAFTNTETAISLSGTTVVPFTVTSNAASKAANRFRVVYRTSGVLPVTLTSVKAFQQNNGITVAWNTQTESGMEQYEVEKSANGTSFSKVNTTPAKAGTSNSYNYFDATPINGANYYRIKAISLNGDVKYSSVVVVRLGDKGTTLSVYPNPVKGNTISVSLNGLTKGNYTLSVFNQLGQQVLNRVISHNGGVATQTIDLGKLSAGLYELRLSNGETVLTEKLIKE